MWFWKIKMVVLFFNRFVGFGVGVVVVGGVVNIVFYNGKKFLFIVVEVL